MEVSLITSYSNWSVGVQRGTIRTIMLGVGMLMLTGCSTITSPISGIPANRLPPQFLAEPKNNLVPIDVSRLSQRPPERYLLDEGDVLSIAVEGILPPTPPDQPPQLPPVNFPEPGSTLPPTTGYPVPVAGDGTISLPLVRPIQVRGKTVDEAREMIRREYLDAGILREEGRRVLTPQVDLMKERTYDIIVVRQDIGSARSQQADAFSRGSYVRGADESASGSLIQLPAYQNDVLHALMASGGTPGLNAKNEIKILRASEADQEKRDQFIREFYAQQQACLEANPCYCPPPIPDDESILRIPLRLPPGVIPSFTPEDIMLEDGDIVYIESRESEVFYTGGLLQGGEWPIPRDYDLDVLGAMAIAGGGIASPVGQGGGGFGGGLTRGIGGVPPGILYIVRPLPCNGQVTIEVDLTRAIQDPRNRPLVQPGDTLILRYKPEEELLNFSLGTFFTFGIQTLLRQIR